MTNQSGNIALAASLLLKAADTKEFITPLNEQFPGLTLGDAYEIQRINTEARLSSGRRLVGCKIGLTSASVQKQLGVDQPDYGVLFDDMEFYEGIPIDITRLDQPKIEAEIAFILGRDLEMPAPTLIDVMRAIDFALPALEIVGSRIKDWKIKLVDTIADNASSSAYVIGSSPRKLSDLDLRACQMVMTANGNEVSTGRGEACLGNPLNAVVWLARTMAKNGTPLKAGQLILSGALGPMASVKSGDSFEASIEGLGKITAHFN